MISPQLNQEENKLQRPNSGFIQHTPNEAQYTSQPVALTFASHPKKSEVCPSSRVSAAAMTSASYSLCKISHVNVGRFHPFTGHEGPQGEQRYSCPLFQTSPLEGDEGSASRPGSTLPPGKSRYPFYSRLGGPQGRSGLVRKISPHRDSIPGPSSPQAVTILLAFIQLINK